MKTIYVTEASPRGENGQDKYDFTAALAHGDQLVFLFPRATHVNPALDPTRYVARAWAGLTTFTDEDLLLLTGHPVGIGICAALAARINHGRVRCLVWHRASRQYVPVMFDLMKG